MNKACLACGVTTYIRVLKSGKVGTVCEGCQREILRLAIEGKLGQIEQISLLENNFRIVQESY